MDNMTGTYKVAETVDGIQLRFNNGTMTGWYVVRETDTVSRFGGDRVTHQDILNVDASNPAATIVGDLADPATLPTEQFDCIILTQTLHLIFDMAAAVAQMHRALAPGGVALITVPGITPLDHHEWLDS